MVIGVRENTLRAHVPIDEDPRIVSITSDNDRDKVPYGYPLLSLLRRTKITRTLKVKFGDTGL